MSRAEETPRQEELRELVARGLEILDADGEAAFAAFLDQHPAQAADIRRLVDQLRASGLVGALPAAGDVELPEELGDFRLIRRLGSGGMGVVWLAEQRSLRREIALKLLHPSQLYFPGAHERFRREFEAVARLDHPGIVPIHAVGEESGVPYFAMERVVGASLAELLRELVKERREVGALTGAELRAALERLCGRSVEPGAEPLFAGRWPDVVTRIVRQVAEALAHAHGRGVLHRDVKPSNVMLGCDGRARLVDFGLARLEGSTQLTRTGANPGSLPYMSPEQLDPGARGGVDARTDVYSLGVTLYELLTLQPAFDHASSEVTRRRILTGDTPPPRRLQRSLDRETETVCQKAMQIEPERRYASAAAFAADLGNLLERQPIAARRPGAVRRATSFARRRPAAVLAAACLVLAATGTLFFQQWREASGREEFQRALRAVLVASFENRAPAAADLALLARQLPDEHQHRALELLQSDPLSKERWREIRQMLPDSLRGNGSGTAAAPPLAPPPPPADAATVRAAFAAFTSTGDGELDGLLRAALAVELGHGELALDELATLPAAPSPAGAAQRLQLEGRARALLQDVEGFLEANAKASELRRQRGS